jgi:hypothetical protein
MFNAINLQFMVIHEVGKLNFSKVFPSYHNTTYYTIILHSLVLKQFINCLFIVRPISEVCLVMN